MPKIFYLGAPATAPSPKQVPLSKALLETGHNTGNLLIGHALRRQLKADFISNDFSEKADYITNNYDYIVIGASNFLFPKFDFGMWADLLEAVSLPCTIIGVGAQAPRYGMRVEVAAGTRRLMQVIASRCQTLGARGTFTASVLNDIGIKNVRVIGCPAMYWSCQPELRLDPKAPCGSLKIALNGSANVVDHATNPAAARRIESQLARLSLERNLPYILQNERELMAIAYKDTELYPAPKTIQALMNQYGLAHLPPESFVQFVQQNTRSYFDIEPWHRTLQSFDFVLGTRFHGCLLGLLAGKASMVLVHDARTQELCELLSIPHLSINDVDTIDPEALYASIDREAVCRSYQERFRNYVQFLDENGVQHNLST
jgi:hypothetical protein